MGADEDGRTTREPAEYAGVGPRLTAKRRSLAV